MTITSNADDLHTSSNAELWVEVPVGGGRLSSLEKTADLLGKLIEVPKDEARGD